MNSFHGVHEIELANTKAFYIDGSEKILVDTGLKPLHNDVLNFLSKNGYNFGEGGFEFFKKGSHHTILNFLKKNKFKVDVIICTHCHGDHTGNLAQLKEELNVPVAAHSADIPFIEGREKVSNPQFVPEELQKHFDVAPCKVDISLKDDEFFNEDLRIIHIEGHTKGNICLLYRNKVLITGDTVLGKNLLNPKMAPEELNLSAEWSCFSYKKAWDNLPKLLNYSFDTILPSHGLSIKKDGKRRLEQLIKRRPEQLIDRVYDTIPIQEKCIKPDRQRIPDEVKRFVWKRDDGSCVKCGSRERLEFDHMVPVSKGGSNTARNIELLCEKCNRKKSDNII